MDVDLLWQKVKAALRSLSTSGKNRDEHLLDTKFRPKRTNRIRVYDDYLERLSDQGKSDWQTIQRKDVLWYARLAIDAGETGQCIKNLPIEPPRMGSIICAMLDLLPEFEYRTGQILVHYQVKP